MINPIDKANNDRMKALEEMRLYTVTEIAPVLGVSRVTLKSYIKGGRLKAVKVGGKWKISQDAIRRFINGY